LGQSTFTISGDRLVLTPRESVCGPHLSIDYFFRSLARSCGNRAFGVLLTGTGTDGTLGLAEIKAAGGITFAQDPKTAEQQEMPRSAINYGCVDFILSEQEIANEIGVISRHPYVKSDPTTKESNPFTDDVDSFEKILAMLKGLSHVDFSHYRATTIKRRILRRMAMRSYTTLAQYFAFLTHDVAEIRLLMKDVLINVTSFFRDEAAFASVTANVFPELAKGRGADTAIRIWVVGCSTGQEAYSLAIALIEYFDDKQVRPLLQIFATDISEPSLVKARAGTYPESIQAEVSPERLSRHFTKVTEGYRVNKSIRDVCVFARHDVTADTPFSKIDLISCRNMLIYLSSTLQMRVIPIFHYALNSPGFLLLGNSETTGRSSDLFSIVDQRQRIYGKNRTVRRVHPIALPASAPKKIAALDEPAVAPTSSLAEYQRTADRLVLGRYVPPGVLVDAKLNIIQFRGNSNEFLDHSHGEASLNLLKMLPYGLAQEIKKAVEESQERNAGVERIGIRFHDRNGPRRIDVRINPIRPHGVQDGCLLIVFEKHPLNPIDRDRSSATLPAAPPSGIRRRGSIATGVGHCQ
jgi:two-component system CheB/CheR fusion protein